MKILLIDNYDSYTYNIYQLICKICGYRPDVIYNNDFDKLSELDNYTHIIISPGPGNPNNDNDIGICKNIFENKNHKILGICLGHQILGNHFNCNIIKSKETIHGQIHKIKHYNDTLFQNIPEIFSVVRYHSLIIDKHNFNNNELEIISETLDEIIMGVKHKKYDFWGVQFHPESICSEYGLNIFENFLKKQIIKLNYCKMELIWNVEQIFFNLFEKEKFWLDGNNLPNTRFSYMGSIGGKLWKKGEFYNPNKLIIYDNQYNKSEHSIDIWNYLQKELDYKIDNDDLPFNFKGGFVGYLSYELKSKQFNNQYPESTFYIVDRFIAIDNLLGEIYLVCYDEDEKWFDEMKNKINNIKFDKINFEKEINESFNDFHICSQEEHIEKIKECKKYLYDGDSYEICLTTQIIKNKSPNPDFIYHNLRKINPAPFSAYLNFLNGVKICCASPEKFLELDKNNVLKAKPIKGTVKRSTNMDEDEELKIQLQNSVKDKAENLMIVDLLRNDLSKVCKKNSVKVDKIFNIESFKTVHQMVSTITGIKKHKFHSLECIKSVFPGGSMTGAPKIRTIEILESIENRNRGIYSGILGYISFDQLFDFNIVIRTIIIHNNEITIGSGGAITVLSDDVDEYNEVLLKLNALVKIIKECYL